jgi:hypothetical protein
MNIFNDSNGNTYNLTCILELRLPFILEVRLPFILEVRLTFILELRLTFILELRLTFILELRSGGCSRNSYSHRQLGQWPSRQ